MKACVLHGIGDLRVEEVPVPPVRDGNVLVRIMACGVCGSDIPRVFSKGTYKFPTIPGHEFAGQVVEIGKKADPGLLGRKVAVFPLLPCRVCPSCEIGEYAQCSNYDYMGSRSDGAFAEYISVPVWNAIPAPDGLSFEEIAMAEPLSVAIHALRQAGLDIGDHVFISGAGPIGLMLGKWAEAWGAGRVVLADIDPAKLAFAERVGFRHVIDARDRGLQNLVRDLTDGRGADICVEGAGSSPSWENCLKAARPFGKVVLMGNPSGDMKLTQNGYWEILRKQLSLHGTWNSSVAGLPKNEWKLALDFMDRGKIDVKPLVTHRVAMEELSGTLAMMRDRKLEYNKVMLVNAAEASR